MKRAILLLALYYACTPAMAANAAAGGALKLDNRELSTRDIQLSVELMSQFERATADGADPNARAIAVCRAAFSETLRGIDLTSKAIVAYRGPLRVVLSFTCQGYLQGAYDIMRGLKQTTP